MIGIFIFIGLLLIVLSFIIEKYPFLLAGYRPDTPKELLKFIRKNFFITGILYIFLGVLPIFLNNHYILTIIMLTPILITLIIINRKSMHYRRNKFL